MESEEELDFNKLKETHVKVFADILEAIVGAIFLETGSFQITD
jgi:dsRNA-specific ribonuclease